MSIVFPPEFHRNPYPLYQKMRQYQPVHYVESLKLWSVYRYDDVRTVLTDYTRFSSQYGNTGTPETTAAQGIQGSSLITSDPPRHTQFRSLVNRAFTPRAVAALEPRIEQITNELLDRVIQTGEIDLIQDLAYPLPVIVIAEMLGIPSEDRDRFKHWSDEVVASADTIIGGQGSESQRAHAEMNEYFRHIIANRRMNPEEDLISALIAAEEDNQHLSEADILSLCWLLLVAGNETTTNLIGNAVLTLLEHPNQLTELQDNPELLASAIEEVLRYRSPVQAMFRITAQDVTLAGQSISAGNRIVAWIGSANRDEAKFPDAQQFNISRNPNPHIAFGHGIHFCLGAPLARLEARVALATVQRRLQKMERINHDPLDPARGFIVHGVTHLPLRFAASRSNHRE